jgi:hypothetical protein
VTTLSLPTLSTPSNSSTDLAVFFCGEAHWIAPLRCVIMYKHGTKLHRTLHTFTSSHTKKHRQPYKPSLNMAPYRVVYITVNLYLAGANDCREFRLVKGQARTHASTCVKANGSAKSRALHPHTLQLPAPQHSHIDTIRLDTYCFENTMGGEARAVHPQCVV